MSTLQAQAIKASKWSLLSEVSARALTPLTFVVLARLLSPSDFGVAAAAAILVNFCQVFWEAGFGKALIQSGGRADDEADVVFWTNVSLGVLIYVIFALGAPLGARVFHDPRLVPVLRVQGLEMILLSLGSVHTVLYQRSLNFRSLFWIRLAGGALPAAASIPLAALGYGYWSLVAGTLFGACVQLVLLWASSPWRPRLRYCPATARRLFRFGAWVTGEALLGWFYVWADALVVGAFLGATELGLYRTGSTLVIMVFGLLLSPLSPVLFSVFSRVAAEDPAAAPAALVKASRIIALVALPAGLGLFLVGQPLAETVLGPRWADAGLVVSYLGLSNGLSWLVGANADAYRANGRPDLNVKIMLAGLAYFVPTYLAVAPYGLRPFLYARLACTALGLPIHLAVARRCLGVRLGDLAHDLRWALAAAASMLVCVSATDRLAGLALSAWPRLACLVGVGAATYVLSLRREWPFLRDLAVSAFSRRPAGA